MSNTKIMDAVYDYETKRTIRNSLIAIVVFVVTCTLSLIVGLTIFSILSEQGSFDILEIISADWGLTGRYGPGEIISIISDTPVELTFIFSFSVILALVVTILIIRALPRMSRKYAQIVRHRRSGMVK